MQADPYSVNVRQGDKVVTRRGGNAHNRKLESLARKLEIGELDVFAIEFTKSLAGYEIEFRNRRFGFDENQNLAERWIRDISAEYPD